MKLSIVTTLYNSEIYILEFYKRCKDLLLDDFEEYEFVFVNDGSPDNSISVVEKIAFDDKNVKVVDLSRNFGHHKALLTGLKYSTGDLVFMLDVDLEEDPSIFFQYIEAMESSDDIDHVFGSQESRKGGVIERITGDIFYKVFNYLTFVPVEKNIITARLMSRRFVNSLIEFREQEVFIAGLATLTGYNSKHILINKKSSSETSYSLLLRFKLLVNGVTSFSSKPLFLIFYLGLIILSGSSLSALYILVLKLTSATVLPGWTSLIIVTLLMGGLVLLCIGIVAIYLSKMFLEQKNRPYVIIKKILNE